LRGKTGLTGVTWLSGVTWLTGLTWLTWLTGLTGLTGLAGLAWLGLLTGSRRPRTPTRLRGLTRLRKLAGLTGAEPERRGLHGGTESLPAAARTSRTVQVPDEAFDALEPAADLLELVAYGFHLRARPEGAGRREAGSVRGEPFTANEPLRQLLRTRRPRIGIARSAGSADFVGTRFRRLRLARDRVSPLLVEFPDLPLELLHLLLEVLHAIVAGVTDSSLLHAPDIVPVRGDSPAARRLEISVLGIEEDVEIQLDVVVDDELHLTDRLACRLLCLASCLATSLFCLAGRFASGLRGLPGRLLGLESRFASNLLRLLYGFASNLFRLLDRLASGFLRLACRLQRFGATLLVAQEWGGKEAGQNEKDSACGSHSMLSVLWERP